MKLKAFLDKNTLELLCADMDFTKNKLKHEFDSLLETNQYVSKMPVLSYDKIRIIKFVLEYVKQKDKELFKKFYNDIKENKGDAILPFKELRKKDPFFNMAYSMLLPKYHSYLRKERLSYLSKP